MAPRPLSQPQLPRYARSSARTTPSGLALAFLLAVLAVLPWGAAPADAATEAPAVHQCNADTYPTSAGWEATCEVVVENTLGSDGAMQSRVTTTWCLAEAGVLPPEGCVPDVTTSSSLVTTVNQCNGILAGGSNVTCRVEVINNVPFGTQTTGVTVNQCVGSGQGGVSPGGPPTNCDPVDSSTSGSTVTQCNGSANGGGAPERVQCSVTGAASALPVTVNQCNGSTAAGSTVTCDVSYTNRFAAAVVGTSTPPATGGTSPVPATSSVSVDAGLGPNAVVTRGASSSSASSASSIGLKSLAATGPPTGRWLPVAFVAMAFALRALLLSTSTRATDSTSVSAEF